MDPAVVTARVGAAGHRARVRKIAAQAITLLRDDFKALPLATSTQSLMIEIPAAAGLGERLGAVVLPIGERPSPGDISGIVGPSLITKGLRAGRRDNQRLV